MMSNSWLLAAKDRKFCVLFVPDDETILRQRQQWTSLIRLEQERRSVTWCQLLASHEPQLHSAVLPVEALAFVGNTDS